MRETMPDTPELNPFDTEVMRWRLLDLFQSDEFQQDEFQAARTVLHTYLQNGDYAAYQLAGNWRTYLTNIWFIARIGLKRGTKGN